MTEQMVRELNVFFTANGRMNVNERSNDKRTIVQSEVVDNDCCK